MHACTIVHLHVVHKSKFFSGTGRNRRRNFAQNFVQGVIHFVFPRWPFKTTSKYVMHHTHFHFSCSPFPRNIRHDPIVFFSFILHCIPVTCFEGLFFDPIVGLFVSFILHCNPGTCFEGLFFDPIGKSANGILSFDVALHHIYYSRFELNQIGLPNSRNILNILPETLRSVYDLIFFDKEDWCVFHSLLCNFSSLWRIEQ